VQYERDVVCLQIGERVALLASAAHRHDKAILSLNHVEGKWKGEPVIVTDGQYELGESSLRVKVPFTVALSRM
jgi:hypothetical protein